VTARPPTIQITPDSPLDCDIANRPAGGVEERSAHRSLFFESPSLAEVEAEQK
jgi:hypothetical protein